MGTYRQTKNFKTRRAEYKVWGTQIVQPHTRKWVHVWTFTGVKFIYFFHSSDTTRWLNSPGRCGFLTGDDILVPCSVHDAIEPYVFPQCISLSGSTWQPVNQFCASLALQPTSPVKPLPILYYLHRLPKLTLETSNSQTMIDVSVCDCQIFVCFFASSH